MADPDPSDKPPARSWVKPALVASLALNLLVLGLVAGALLGGPGERRPDRRPMLGELGFGPFVAALPSRDRVEMGRALGRQAGAFRENRAAIRTQFEALLTALRADPYDPAAVRRLIAEQQDRVADRQALGRQLLLDRIDAMSAAERAAYADALDRALRRRPPRDRD